MEAKKSCIDSSTRRVKLLQARSRDVRQLFPIQYSFAYSRLIRNNDQLKPEIAKGAQCRQNSPHNLELLPTSYIAAHHAMVQNAIAIQKNRSAHVEITPAVVAKDQHALLVADGIRHWLSRQFREPVSHWFW
jgi:hypothetical protein